MVIGYLTFPFGLIYDYIGPKPIFTIGIVLNVVGTLMFALVFNGTVPANVAGVSIINAILNLGCSLYDMGSVLTVLSWFPLDRGLVIACMKTATGLGSSIVSTIYSTYFAGDHTTYMYFLLGYSVFIGCVSICVIYLPPFHMTGRRASHYTEEKRRKAADYESVYMQKKAPLKRFIIAFVLLFSTLIVVCTRSVVFVFLDNPTGARMHAPTAIMIALYVLLLFVIFPWSGLDKQLTLFDSKDSKKSSVYACVDGKDESEEKSVSRVEPTADTMITDSANNQKMYPVAEAVGDVDGEAPLADAAEPGAGAEGELNTSDDVRRALRLATETEKIAPQFLTGFFYNVRRPTLLCMWVTGFCTAGVVLVVMMNSTEIYLATSEDPDDKQRPALYVAITGIGSALGRIVMAFCEVWTVSKPADTRIPITTFYVVPPLLGLLSCIFFLVIPPAGLLLPMLLSGFGNGFYAACEVITARTIFSIDISKHYNSLFFFEVVSLIFMNRLLFGELMTKNSVQVGGVPMCLGRKQCIQTTFIVLTCLSAVGLVASIGIHLTYRAYARGEHTKRAEHRAQLEGLLRQMEAEELQRRVDMVDAELAQSPSS